MPLTISLLLACTASAPTCAPAAHAAGRTPLPVRMPCMPDLSLRRGALPCLHTTLPATLPAFTTTCTCLCCYTYPLSSACHIPPMCCLPLLRLARRSKILWGVHPSALPCCLSSLPVLLLLPPACPHTYLFTGLCLLRISAGAVLPSVLDGGQEGTGRVKRHICGHADGYATSMDVRLPGAVCLPVGCWARTQGRHGRLPAISPASTGMLSVATCFTCLCLLLLPVGRSAKGKEGRSAACCLPGVLCLSPALILLPLPPCLLPCPALTTLPPLPAISPATRHLHASHTTPLPAYLSGLKKKKKRSRRITALHAMSCPPFWDLSHLPATALCLEDGGGTKYGQEESFFMHSLHFFAISCCLLFPFMPATLCLHFSTWDLKEGPCLCHLLYFCLFSHRENLPAFSVLMPAAVAARGNMLGQRPLAAAAPRVKL